MSVEDAWLFPIVRARPSPISCCGERSPPFYSPTGRFVCIVWALLDHQVLRERMDQYRVQVVFRFHRCWQRLVGERHLHPLSHAVYMFATEFQMLRSLVRFAVGKTRWRSFGKYSLKYTKGNSKGGRFRQTIYHALLPRLTSDSFKNWGGFRGVRRRSFCSRLQSSRRFSTPFLIPPSLHF